MTTKPSQQLTLKDKLSRLSYRQACKLLGERGEKVIQEGLAAADRKYCVEADIPWVEEAINVGDFEPIDFYARCYEYYALDAPPFVPISETRETMRTLELCRNSGLAK